MKVLNTTKLILDDHGNNLDSFRISLESFRSFRGPLLLKPITGQEPFFAVSYGKPTLGSKKEREGSKSQNGVTSFMDGYLKY